MVLEEAIKYKEKADILENKFEDMRLIYEKNELLAVKLQCDNKFLLDQNNTMKQELKFYITECRGAKVKMENLL